jgi:hypothetical protein
MDYDIFKHYTMREVVDTLSIMLSAIRAAKRKGAGGVPHDEEILKATIKFFKTVERKEDGHKQRT